MNALQTATTKKTTLPIIAESDPKYLELFKVLKTLINGFNLTNPPKKGYFGELDKIINNTLYGILFSGLLGTSYGKYIYNKVLIPGHEIIFYYNADMTFRFNAVKIDLDSKKTEIISEPEENKKSINSGSKHILCKNADNCKFGAKCHFSHTLEEQNQALMKMINSDQLTREHTGENHIKTCKPCNHVKTCKPCKFGDNCTRQDCHFSHPRDKTTIENEKLSPDELISLLGNELTTEIISSIGNVSFDEQEDEGINNQDPQYSLFGKRDDKGEEEEEEEMNNQHSKYSFVLSEIPDISQNEN